MPPIYDKLTLSKHAGIIPMTIGELRAILAKIPEMYDDDNVIVYDPASMTGFSPSYVNIASNHPPHDKLVDICGPDDLLITAG